MRIQKAIFRNSVAATIALGIAISPMLASAGSGQTAKISMSEARAIALKAWPGKIMQEELEREGGGSGLRYSFDIRRGPDWREVGVDAMTGGIVENIHEKANPGD